MKTKCRLVGYRRVSTQKQGQSGLGLEAQDAAIAAYVASTGCDLVASYTEVESGKNADRPELAKAIAHARRIGATLVIAKLDRLARNVHFISGLMETGVNFVACDSPGDDRFILHVKASCAEDEARKISVRTREALEAAKARGVKLGGVRPGQHVLTPEDRAKGRAKGAAKAGATKRVRAIDAYADLLPRMESMKTEGLSLAKIAERLNASGSTTRTGAMWSAVQVMRAMNRVK